MIENQLGTYLTVVISSLGRPPSSATAPPKGLGMQLGKNQKANQFLESLKAEGEVILEDVRPSTGPSRSAAPPLTDPITLSVDEKLNVTLKRDGGVSNFDVQGTLSLQILNQEDGLIQVQVLFLSLCTLTLVNCILFVLMLQFLGFHENDNLRLNHQFKMAAIFQDISFAQYDEFFTFKCYVRKELAHSIRSGHLNRLIVSPLIGKLLVFPLVEKLYWWLHVICSGGD